MAKLHPGLIAAVVAGVALLADRPAAAQSDDPGVPVDVPQGDEYSDTDPSALTDFRATLDPHGQWVDDPTYGTTWTPDPNEVGADFEPYDTAGSWGYTGGDYTWLSDYAWGWVCFHYGRWVLAGGRWLWVPGRQYAGAWVDWRLTDDGSGMIGWAPAPPSWSWAGGSAYGIGFASPEPWAFAPYGGVFGPGLSSRVIVGNAAASPLGHSRPYLRAQPPSPGEPFAQAIMHGPPPASLGIDVASIPRVALGPNELRARQMARPSTAVAMGAHAPTPHVVRARPPVPRAIPAGRGPVGGGRARR